MNDRLLFMFMSLVFALPSCISSQELDEPRSLLKKAIAAHGGAQNINKPRMGTLKATSKDNGSEITQEEIFDLPKRWKRVTIGNFLGEKRVGFTLMIEGKYWEWEEGGEVREVNNKDAGLSHFDALLGLVQLTEAKIALAPLGEIKVKSQPAIGFRATGHGKTVDYYVDKRTGLLVQVIQPWHRPGKEYEVKTLLGDFKEVDGVRFPFRRTAYLKRSPLSDYVNMGDLIVTELRILQTVPSKSFSLPGKE